MMWLSAALAFAKRIPWQLVAAIAIALGVWMYGNHRYSEGREDERAAWKKAVEKRQDAINQAGAEAATTDSHTKRSGQRAIAARREVIDNAKAELPDQGLTDRQRARACAELRRQGDAGACEPAAPSP